MATERNLGTASGRILINIQDVEKAAERLSALSQQMTKTLAQVNGSSGGRNATSGIVSDKDVANAKELSATLKTIETALKKKMGSATPGILGTTPSEASAVVSQVTQVEKVERARLSVMERQEASARRLNNELNQQLNKVERAATSGAGAGAGGRTGNPENINTPTFAQFALFPYASLAQGLGATQVAGGLYTASSALGAAELASSAGAVNRLAEQLRNMNGVIGSMATVAGKATAGMGTVVSSIASITAVAAPIVLVFAAIGAALSALEQQAQESAREVQELIERERERRSMLGQSTTGDLMTARQGVVGDISGGNERLVRAGEILSQLSELEQQAPGISNRAGVFQGLFASLLRPELRTTLDSLDRAARNEFGVSGVFELRDAYGELVGDQAALGLSLQGINESFQSATVAANDLMEAQERYADQVSTRMMLLFQARREFGGLPQQGLNDRLTTAQSEYVQLSSLLNSVTGEQREQVMRQIKEVQAQIQVLEQLTASGQGMRNTFEAAGRELQVFNQAMADFGAETARMMADRRLGAGRDLQDFTLGRARRIEDFERQRADAENDFARASQQRQAAYNQQNQQQEDEQRDKRAELLENFYREEQRREEDHQIRMAQIARDGRISVLESAARLDARGVFEAQRRTREQQRSEQEKFTLERARRLEELALQLRDLVDGTEKQRTERRRAFERAEADARAEFELQQQRRQAEFDLSLQREDQDRQIRLARQQQDFAIQDARRRDDFLKQQSQQMTHYNSLNAIAANGLNGIQSKFVAFFNAMITATGDATAKAGGGLGRSFNGRSFASGTTYVPATGMYQLHTGEMVLNPALSATVRGVYGGNLTQAQAGGMLGGGGGVNVNIGDIVLGDIGAYSPSQVKDMVRDAILYGGVGDELMRSFYGQARARMGAVR